MSLNLEYSQVIALSPNRFQTFSATLPSPSKPSYFAFGCESLINVINRTDFSRITIQTPDSTSPIISLTFSGSKYLFCLNKKGILYAYSQGSLLSGPIGTYDIHCTPISIAASNRYIFYIYDETLFQLSTDDFFTNKKEPKMLTDKNEEKYTELSISPCGRSLVAYTIGSNFPEIWFYPFREKQHSNLPIRSNLIDFKWGLSETLLCVTATEDGIIRIWEEQNDSLSLHQKSWFHFDQRIKFVCFCLPINERHQPQHFHPAQSTTGSVFPLMKSYPYNIIAGLKNGLIYVFKENNQPQLSEITHFLLNSQTDKSGTDRFTKNKNNCVNSNCINDNSFSGDVLDKDRIDDDTFRFYSIADYRDDYIENQFKLLITLTLFSKKSLSFHYIEIGDSSVLITVPYRISFISSNIKSIETNEFNHVLTQMEDDKIVNWSLVKVEKVVKNEFVFVFYIKNEKSKKNFGISFNNKTVIVSQFDKDKKVSNVASYQLNFVPLFWNFVNQNGHVIGFISSIENKENVVIFITEKVEENEFVITSYPIEKVPNFTINKVAFHSSDLFAVASDEDIQAYLFQDGQFIDFLSLHIENNSILFLPKLLFAVASKRCITFFSLSSKEFSKIMSVQSTHITAMNYINKSLIVGTKHVLFRLFLSKEMFPLPLSADDPSVYTAALSICHFSVIQDFINNEKPTLNSFLKRTEAECFSIKPTNLKEAKEDQKETEDNLDKKENDEAKAKLNGENEVKSNHENEGKIELPYFDEFWESLPLNWPNVDNCGMKFIFSMQLIRLHFERIQKLMKTFSESIEKRGILELKSLIQIKPEELINKINHNIQRCISFFSIWGLLSSDQSNLTQILSFKSIGEICGSYLPLWMKSDVLLKNTIEKFILDNIPQPDSPNYDFDAFLLLCVIFDKKTIASKIAKRSYNNKKIATFLGNSENTAPEKIEKSAYAAYSQHRFSLAAMFFYLKGMKEQAVSVLCNDTQNPLLVILIARLIGHEKWASLIKNEEFYLNWWTEKNREYKENALNCISKFEFNSIRIHKFFIGDKKLALENTDVIRDYDAINAQISLMVAVHKYEILKKLKFASYRKYLLDIQKVPFLIVMYVLNENSNNMNLTKLSNDSNENIINNSLSLFPNVLTKETDKTKEKVGDSKSSNSKKKKNEKPADDFGFSFGAGLDYIDDNIDSDAFSSDEEDTDQNEDVKTAETAPKNDGEIEAKNDKMIEFKSNITEMFLADSFESTYSEPLLLSEEYVITLLSELYNRTFTRQTVQFLLSVAKDLLALPQSLHIISMIMFSITFSLSDFTWMQPIIQFNFDPLYIITVLDHYTELINSDDENNPFNKAMLKKKSNENKGEVRLKLNSSPHLTKSNSMGSFNLASRVTSYPASLQHTISNGVSKNIHLLNTEKSDELFNAVTTDYSSSNEEDNESLAQALNRPHNYGQSDNKDDDDNLPDFFSVVCPNMVPTRGDKELACFVAFDRMLTVLNELLTNSNPTIFTSFLHHRHRLMYRAVKTFRFSKQEIMRDLDAAGLMCQVIDRMRHTRESRTWAVTLADKLTSPFFCSTKNANSTGNASMSNCTFRYTSSYNIKTASSRVYDVCINAFNNQQVALAAQQVSLLNSISPAMLPDSSYSIAEHELKRNDIDGLSFSSSGPEAARNKEEFKSPLLSFLTQQKIAKWEKVTRGLMLTRTYRNAWPKANGQSGKSVRATCIASHPTKECFVSGDASGRLHYWKFTDQSNGLTSPNSLTAARAVKFFHGDYKVRSVKFNKAGDRICSIDSEGRVAVSDFIGFQSFSVESQYTSIGWLNNDNQFVVCSNDSVDLKDQISTATKAAANNVNASLRQGSIPKLSPSVDNLQYLNSKLSPLKDSKDLRGLNNGPYQNRNISASTTFSATKKSATIQIFDILTGDKPVAVFDMNKPLPLPKVRVPIDVYGSLVLSGYNDGSAAIFDVRCGMRLANLPLHNQPVTTVKFDESGSFFVTGGMDNKVVIAEALAFADIDQLDDVLPNYDPKSRKRGIFNIAVSKQTIIACGYSPHIHVWTKTEPSPM